MKTDHTVTQADILAEYLAKYDTPEGWADIPEDFKYLAFDLSGELRSYNCHPTCVPSASKWWICSGTYRTENTIPVFDNANFDWENSIRSRKFPVKRVIKTQEQKSSDHSLKLISMVLGLDAPGEDEIIFAIQKLQLKSIELKILKSEIIHTQK